MLFQRPGWDIPALSTEQDQGAGQHERGIHGHDQQDRGPGPPQTRAAIRSSTGAAHPATRTLAAVAVPVVR